MSFAQKRQCHGAALIRLQVACLESHETCLSAAEYDMGFVSTDSSDSLTLSLSDLEPVPQRVKTVLRVDSVQFPCPQTQSGRHVDHGQFIVDKFNV